MVAWIKDRSGSFFLGCWTVFMVAAPWAAYPGSPLTDLTVFRTILQKSAHRLIIKTTELKCKLTFLLHDFVSLSLDMGQVFPPCLPLLQSLIRFL